MSIFRLSALIYEVFLSFTRGLSKIKRSIRRLSFRSWTPAGQTTSPFPMRATPGTSQDCIECGLPRLSYLSFWLSRHWANQRLAPGWRWWRGQGLPCASSAAPRFSTAPSVRVRKIPRQVMPRCRVSWGEVRDNAPTSSLYLSLGRWWRGRETAFPRKPKGRFFRSVWLYLTDIANQRDGSFGLCDYI